jgi:hypothetical protein
MVQPTDRDNQRPTVHHRALSRTRDRATQPRKPVDRAASRSRASSIEPWAAFQSASSHLENDWALLQNEWAL